MPEKEFKIMTNSRANEIQENSDRKLNEMRKMIHDLNDKFNKGK